MKYKFVFLGLLTITCLFNTFCNGQISNPNKNEIQKRHFYNAKFEPQDGIIHGAGQDLKSFNLYAYTVGYKLYPKIFMSYTGIVGSVKDIKKWAKGLKKELSDLPSNVMPQIGLNLTSGKDNGSGQDRAVAEGKYDENITELIKQIKSLNRSSYLRIGYEFEGSWNGYSPDSYREVFIKVTKEIRKQEANIATVWCAGGGSAGFIPLDSLMQYYPGDSWVDWWGIDIFSPEEITDSRLLLFYSAAEEHKKPVMIGETTPRYVGVKNGQDSWDKWFGPFFEMMYNNPGVKAFCYINWDWKYWSDAIGFSWHDWEDARIERNEFVKNAYIKEISKPIFLHSTNN